MKKGSYVILEGDCLDVMASMDAGSIDCVITDPPYSGFGFTNENYFGVFSRFFEKMSRCAAGDAKRIAISQPKIRLMKFSKMVRSTRVVQIPDAFVDRRGEGALFLLANPLLTEPQAPENWSNIPDSTHPNQRDVNKMAVIVKMMSNPGDTILDPFAGSGAIGLAAVLLGRNFVGIELFQDRASDAISRFDAVGASRLEI